MKRWLIVVAAALLLAGCATAELVKTAETAEQRFYAYKAAYAGLLVPVSFYNSNPICTPELLAAGAGCARKEVAEVFCQATRDARSSWAFAAQLIAQGGGETGMKKAEIIGLAAVGVMAKGFVRANLLQAAARSITNSGGQPAMAIAARAFDMAFQLAVGAVLARTEIESHQAFVAAMVVENRGPTLTELENLNFDIRTRTAAICAPFEGPPLIVATPALSAEAEAIGAAVNDLAPPDVTPRLSVPPDVAR